MGRVKASGALVALEVKAVPRGGVVDRLINSSKGVIRANEPLFEEAEKAEGAEEAKVEGGKGAKDGEDAEAKGAKEATEGETREKHEEGKFADADEAAPAAAAEDAGSSRGLDLVDPLTGEVHPWATRQREGAELSRERNGESGVGGAAGSTATVIFYSSDVLDKEVSLCTADEVEFVLALNPKSSELCAKNLVRRIHSFIH